MQKYEISLMIIMLYILEVVHWVNNTNAFKRMNDSDFTGLKKITL